MVNIIIPLYNSKEHLPRLLDTIVAQTKKMFFLTIVQDKDEQDYTSIIEEYEQKSLHIKHIKSKKRLGPGNARQLGIDSTPDSCQHIMFVDADDLLLPRAVEILTRSAGRNNADITVSDVIIDKWMGESYLQSQSPLHVVHVHGKLYKTKFLKERQIRFHPKIYYNEDSYFNYIAFNSTKEIYEVKEPTYVWIDNKKSATHSGTFFEDSWIDYIKGQLWGFARLNEDRKMNGALFANSVLYIYAQYQEAQLRGIDTTEIDMILNKFFLTNKHKLYTQEKDFWDAIKENEDRYTIIDKKLCFFKETFYCWFIRMTGENYENLCG